KTLDGYTALHLAVDKESKEIVQTLIKAGADLDIKTLDGYTAMHLAADNGNEEIVQALITGWADLDTKTLDGYTALHLAEDNGNEEIVQALIEAGVNKSIPSANLSIPNYLLALGSPTSRPKDFTVSEDLDIDSVISQILEETTPSQPVQAVPEPEPEALTTSEIERLRSLIVDNWNIGALSSEAKRVILTVRIRMDETGKPIEIELYNSDGGVNDKAVEVAFEVARKAITKGLENGHDLPKDKYDLWKEVLYTFNPEQMRKR
ncbi:MAG: ankyrin repeat domain-containing protein, partial [Paracoccaceae bacterium]|nr:ankyrin repeat domain-containing protein [Paracoccaceae bacterium]